MSQTAGWLPGKDKKEWFIWAVTFAIWTIPPTGVSLLACSIVLFDCARRYDTKNIQNDEMAAKRQRAYCLLVSATVLAVAWLFPVVSLVAVSFAAMALSGQARNVTLSFLERLGLASEELTSLRAMRFYCLIVLATLGGLSFGPQSVLPNELEFASRFNFDNCVLPLVLIPLAFLIAVLVKQILACSFLNRFKRAMNFLWHDFAFFVILFSQILCLVGLITLPRSPGDFVVNWLFVSQTDARISSLPSSFADFSLFAKTILSIVLNIFLMPSMLSISAFLTAFAGRVSFGASLRGWTEAFIDLLRQPVTKVKIKEAVPWLHNTSMTLYWLGLCYLVIFLVIAAAPGAIGAAFVNWMDFAFVDAGFRPYSVYSYPQLRIFLASLVAMIGMVPLAVTGCAFLPALSGKYISVSNEGILLPMGPFLGLWLRPFRSWSDFKSIRVDARNGETRLEKQTLVVSFFSGGSLRLRLHQIETADLRELLSAVDERADRCLVAPEILELRGRLAEAETSSAFPEAGRLRNLPADNFRSTVFVPYEVGQFIPDTNMRVVRLLSAKQLAAVYLVRRSDGALAVAKQFFFPSGIDSDAVLSAQVERLKKNFDREYELLSSLDDNRIARVFDLVELKDSSIFVLEYARGLDLRDLVSRDGPLKEALVIEIGRQLCDVMVYLHSQSPAVLHRDITPDNLVIDDNLNLKLIDFGAAHQFLEGITGTLIGKQCYVAPEQLRGEASTRSDIYSFGCTLYFLLTGEDPLALSQSDPGVNAVSPALRKLLLECTEFEESKRPHSFLAIRLRLEELAGEAGFKLKLNSRSAVSLKRGEQI